MLGADFGGQTRDFEGVTTLKLQAVSVAPWGTGLDSFNPPHLGAELTIFLQVNAMEKGKNTRKG